MTLARPVDMGVYAVFCVVLVVTVYIFCRRRHFIIISERTPILVLWMQVPIFCLMTIMCLSLNELIPASNAYGVTVFAAVCQTLFLGAVFTRIVNLGIKNIHQQLLSGLLNKHQASSSSVLHSSMSLGLRCEVRYLLWRFRWIANLATYQKPKHTFYIYAVVQLICMIVLTVVFCVNPTEASSPSLNNALYWYSVVICTSQIATVILVWPLVIIDVFLLTIELLLVSLFLVADVITLLLCRYTPPDSSSFLATNTCTHFTYGCLFTINVLTIGLPAMLTYLPFFQTTQCLSITKQQSSRSESVFTMGGWAMGDEEEQTDHIHNVDCPIQSKHTNQVSGKFLLPPHTLLSLSKIRKNKDMLHTFFQHLGREFATENYLFLVCVKKYKSEFKIQMQRASKSSLQDDYIDKVDVGEQLHDVLNANGKLAPKTAQNVQRLSACTESEQKVLMLAHRIYDKFLAANSVLEVNLPDTIVRDVKRQLEEKVGLPTLFDKCARHIEIVIDSDVVRRFQRLHCTSTQTTGQQEQPTLITN